MLILPESWSRVFCCFPLPTLNSTIYNHGSGAGGFVRKEDVITHGFFFFSRIIERRCFRTEEVGGQLTTPLWATEFF